MGEDDRDVAVADRRTVEQRAVARAEPDQLRVYVLRVGTAAGGERRGRFARHILLRASAAGGDADGEEREQACGEAHYIRSGAWTPTRSRLRAMTVCVARTRPSRNAWTSLSRTRCSW
jgi:hypothetical protein